MSSTTASLLTGRDIFTTGRIIFKKPWYINWNGMQRRIGYKLAIQTPHHANYRGHKIPVYISAYGKSRAWHTYRMLHKNQERIGISGIRAATKLYESRGQEKKKGFWIILKKKPAPNIILLGSMGH